MRAPKSYYQRFLGKSSGGKPKEWANIIDDILFAHRVSIHYSTKYSPFFLMYNRHPILPIDIKYDLIDNNAVKEPESNPYDITTFQAVLESAALIREATNEKASQNIKNAQAKHKKDYKNRHSTISTTLPIGSKVLLQNQRRQDRKGGKFSYKWIGPYTIKSISKTGLCVLINEKGFVLKKKYNVSLLKPVLHTTPKLIQTLLKRLMKKTKRATKTGNNKRLVKEPF